MARSERRTIEPPLNICVLKRSSIVSALFFLLGVVAGYFWLRPVFVPPGSPELREAGQSVDRILRVAAVMLLFPLVVQRVISLLPQERILRLLLWTFIGAPAVSLVMYPDVGFLVGTLGPIMVSGVSLVVLCALTEKQFAVWTAGAGFSALVFLLFGLSRYGLEATDFYGTSRVHVGFIHPTQSSAVVLLGGLFLTQLTRRIFGTHNGLRRILITGISGGTALLLFLTFSRNTLLVLILVAFGAVYSQVFREPVPRFLLSCVIIILVLLGYWVAVWGDQRYSAWIALDEISSYRLSVYREYANDLGRASLPAWIVGPIVSSRSMVPGVGFASAESIYMSLFNNYGLLTLISFFIFLLLVAKRLSRRSKSLAYGAWCAITIFFAIDAQGITPSNLAVFILLAYTVRSAMAQRVRSAGARRVLPVAL